MSRGEASSSWLTRLSGLKFASYPEKQDRVWGGWRQPGLSFEASTALCPLTPVHWKAFWIWEPTDSEFSLIKGNPMKHWVGKTWLKMQPVSAKEWIRNRLGKPPIQSVTRPESCRPQSRGWSGCHHTFVAGSHERDRRPLWLVAPGSIYFCETRQTGEVLWSVGYPTLAFHELARFPEIIWRLILNCQILPPVDQ